MKPRSGSTFREFPMKILTAALLFTIGLFMTSGWLIWKSYEDYSRGQLGEYRFQFLINSLNSGPELTVLARRAVSTNQLGSLDQYNYMVKEITTAVQEIKQLALDEEIRQLALRLEDANNKMLGMEQHAFQLFREGNVARSRELLQSADYRKYMNIYDQCNSRLDGQLQGKVETKIRKIKNRAIFALAAVGISLPLLLIVWLIALRMVKRHLTARIRAEEQLRHARDELEVRVHERTRELSEANIHLQKEIAERRRAQEALQRSEAIYREAIENAAGVPYRLIYKNNNYDFVGAGIAPLLGYAPEEFTYELLRRIVREVVIVEPGIHYDLLEYVRAFQEGKVDQYRVDLHLQTRGGEFKWVSDCSVPIRDQQTGELVGSLGILQDITKRKQVEEQARIQQEQLIQADKMVSLGTLVSGVAHEINNPNNFIMLNAPTLHESWQSIEPLLDAYYRENGDFLVGGLNYSEMKTNIPVLFSGILEGAKRIRNIVQELRDFSRQDPGFYQENVNVNAAVNSALLLISSMIRKSTDRFEVALDETLPPIRGNFQRLEQVLINLIQNACQALPDRRRGIRLTTAYNAHARSIVIQVRDEGVGIPRENLKNIVDPFFTTKRDVGGVGLGLSISTSIVKQHGGVLEIASQPEQGTTATITLPIQPVELAAGVK
jgi:PAS domain S-box-containing protein